MISTKLDVPFVRCQAWIVSYRDHFLALASFSNFLNLLTEKFDSAVEALGPDCPWAQVR